MKNNNLLLTLVVALLLSSFGYTFFESRGLESTKAAKERVARIEAAMDLRTREFQDSLKQVNEKLDRLIERIMR